MTPINRMTNDDLDRLTHIVRKEFRECIKYRIKKYVNGNIFRPPEGSKDLQTEKMFHLRVIEEHLVAERKSRNAKDPSARIDTIRLLESFPIPHVDVDGNVVNLAEAQKAVTTHQLFTEIAARQRRLAIKKGTKT